MLVLLSVVVGFILRSYAGLPRYFFVHWARIHNVRVCLRRLRPSSKTRTNMKFCAFACTRSLIGVLSAMFVLFTTLAMAVGKREVRYFKPMGPTVTVDTVSVSCQRGLRIEVCGVVDETAPGSGQLAVSLGIFSQDNPDLLQEQIDKYSQGKTTWKEFDHATRKPIEVEPEKIFLLNQIQGKSLRQLSEYQIDAAVRAMYRLPPPDPPAPTTHYTISIQGPDSYTLRPIGDDIYSLTPNGSFRADVRAVQDYGATLGYQFAYLAGAAIVKERLDKELRLWHKILLHAQTIRPFSHDEIRGVLLFNDPAPGVEYRVVCFVGDEHFVLRFGPSYRDVIVDKNGKPLTDP